jgi:hypothetical protein
MPQSLYIRMVSLEGFRPSMSLSDSRNAFGSGYSCSERGDIGHFILDGSLSDVRVIMFAEPAGGRIDDQVNFFVLNAIHNIGATFMHL